MSEEGEEFGYPLTGEQLRDQIAADPADRFQYFLEKCKETGQVWSFGAEEELIVIGDDDEEGFVVAFPHPEFGQDWFETTELEDLDLVALSTNDWAREVLPGLQEAGIQVLVFPSSASDGTLMAAGELATQMLMA